MLTIPTAPDADPDPLAEAFLAHLALERGCSPRTVDAYRYALERGLAAIRRRRRAPTTLATITADEIRAWMMAEAAAKVSPASRALWLAAWRSCYTFAVKRHLRADNPALDVAYPKRPKRKPRPLHVADATRLLDAAWRGPWLGPRNRAICEVLYGAGLRISELCGLTVDDLDLRAATVRVVGKGDKERILPLPAVALAALVAYLPVRKRRLARLGAPDTKALFLGRGAHGVVPQAVRHVLRRRAAALDLPHTWPHRLRTSCATHLLDGGADIRDVQELLGHERLETTVAYIGASPNRLADVVRRAHPRGVA